MDYLPLSLGDVPKLFRNGQIPLDVAMIQVALASGERQFETNVPDVLASRV